MYRARRTERKDGRQVGWRDGNAGNSRFLGGTVTVEKYVGKRSGSHRETSVEAISRKHVSLRGLLAHACSSPTLPFIASNNTILRFVPYSAFDPTAPQPGSRLLPYTVQFLQRHHSATKVLPTAFFGPTIPPRGGFFPPFGSGMHVPLGPPYFSSRVFPRRPVSLS